MPPLSWVSGVSVSDVFQIFGEKITKIKISQRDFGNGYVSKLDEILRLTSMHCAMDKLKYLNLQFNSGFSVNKRYLYAVLPFLRNIETVVITGDDYDRVVDCCSLLSYYTCRARLARLGFDPSINDFIDTVVANAVNIKSIEIRKVQFTSTFFYVLCGRNLETLVLNDCHIREPDGKTE